MRFRTRLAVGFTAAAALPLLVLAWGVRREMTARLEQQADRRIATVLDQIQSDLAADLAATRARLLTLSEELARENRFRLALRGDGVDRLWLLDWAESAMRPTALALLQLRDSTGRILSSGHFRNEFDRLDPVLPALVSGMEGGWALVQVQGPRDGFLVLAAVDSFRVAGRRFTLLGGTPVDSARLAALGVGEIAVSLHIGDSALPPAVGEVELPYVDRFTRPGSARLILARDPSVLEALRAGVDRWTMVTLGITLLLALALAIWLASRLSRPLTDLAEQTAELDLDRLDQRFDTGREDEIGTLSRGLDAMTRRLRVSLGRLREAERRAATGDLARQINHDVKNGLAPIRHVLRHWTETAERRPEQLLHVFRERRGTMEASVEYLDKLARNYARLAPAPDLRSSDVNPLLVEVARASAADGAQVEARPGPGVPPVRADPVVLRRILENLVANALDALAPGGGRVTLASELVPNGAETRVRLTVTDTGRGMSREELDRAFDDFHTTKIAGTGLGLSVVRRLVADLGGSLRVETAPGRGTAFMVEIPAA